MKDPFSWPEDPRITDLRNQLNTALNVIEAIRHECIKAAVRDGRVSRRVLEHILKGDTN